MPLLDAFAERVGPGTIQSLRTVQNQLHEAPQRPERPIMYRRLDLEPDVADALASSFTPSFGIFGVGLWGGPDDFEPAVFLLGSPALERPMVVGPVGRTLMGQLVQERLGYLPADLTAVLVPPMDPQRTVAPGASIVCAGNRGTLGMPVWTTRGRKGVTTAGHVGRSVGAKVTHGEHVLGYVDSTDHPGINARGVNCADLAVIELHPSVDSAWLGATPSGVSNAGQYDELTTIQADGGRKGFVRGVSESWASTPQDGAWGDVLLTDEAISVPGSSGALCVDQSGRAVGHIVGGAVPAFSAVQDVNYQLTKSDIRPRIT